MRRRIQRHCSVLFLTALAFSVGFATTNQAFAGVIFNFNFLDAVDVGFNANGQVVADRRAGLQRAGDYVSSVLGPSYSASIDLDVKGDTTDSSLLASAGSNFSGARPASNGFSGRGDVMTKILGGADPSPGADGSVSWDFQNFDWAPLDVIGPGQLDLISTAIHELTHAIGFASDINQNGSSGYGDMPGTASVWSPFDEFVADMNGNSIIDFAGVLDGGRWDAASLGGAGMAGLQFNGANAVAAAGGPVYLYSPNAWRAGSSGSHLDTDFYNPADGKIESMMNHSSTFGAGQFDIRTYSPIEIGILKDIGYANIGAAAVPEPTSLAVFAALGAVMFVRQRKNRIARSNV
ncbi:hypothetical protein Poly51_26310 [Rubripirellula tenax]|uniref:PEP-CTERM protein-sorting domain-containing protein n=1 Tax=Rubripirellula tenax TaxID=2528015 RepID=A0A5C6F897_9BACT|nr:PEP-CTERM sorting domain-containing protein [Rubripirellula tenax]TWU56714.1 hypothetical protein Poly51_26310 [Rubripirellula tenax]